jgi:nucleoside-diphosphate-sugar epimerase
VTITEAGTVVVTGGGGFLGSAIVRQLRASGWPTRSLQRSAPRDGTPVIAGDIRDPGTVVRALRGARAVIHAAGLAHVVRPTDSASFADVNERGTEVVARAAATVGVAHLILISSVAVYGQAGPERREDTPGRPIGPYAMSKAAAERRATAALRGSSVRLTVLRVATLYGEGDRGNVQRVLQALDRGRFVWIGRGTNHKTLLHVDDAARACVLPLGRGGDAVEIYNVGASPATMRMVIEGLAGALGCHVPSWYLPAGLALGVAKVARALMPGRGGALHDSVTRWLTDDVYPTVKFSRQFNFEPRITLAEGLRRQVAWWRRSGGVTHGC